MNQTGVQSTGSRRQARDQHRGAAAAEPGQYELSDCAVAGRASHRQRVSFQRLRAERRERGVGVKRTGRVDEFAVRGEHRDGAAPRREQFLGTLGERQGRAHRLGRHDEDAVRVAKQCA